VSSGEAVILIREANLIREQVNSSAGQAGFDKVSVMRSPRVQAADLKAGRARFSLEA
jgi:hypothetical protein